jgi:hypothetical protein
MLNGDPEIGINPPGGVGGKHDMEGAVGEPLQIV